MKKKENCKDCPIAECKNSGKDLVSEKVCSLIDGNICIWKESYNSDYITNCKGGLLVIANALEENGIKYCPYCGKKIKIKRYKLGE